MITKSMIISKINELYSDISSTKTSIDDAYKIFETKIIKLKELGETSLSIFSYIKSETHLDDETLQGYLTMALLLKYCIEKEKYRCSDSMILMKIFAKLLNCNMIYLFTKTKGSIAWYFNLEKIKLFDILLDSEIENIDMSKCISGNIYNILYSTDSSISSFKSDNFDLFIDFFISQYVENYINKYETFNGSLNKRFDVKMEKITIMHLSDCHIKNDYKCKDYVDVFLSEFYKRKIFDVDFIVITGDLIQASNSTSGIIDNSITALGFIEKISKAILGNVWVNRLIIVPGNHDYCLISEMEAVTERRRISSSKIVKNTEEYHKFAFYNMLFNGYLKKKTIGNLKNIIDDYSFNFDYDGKTKYLNFYCFNTSKNSNSDIPNKVTLECTDVITDIGTYNILLMHHTPLFNINYYFDCLGMGNYAYKCKEEFMGKYLYGCSEVNRKKIINAKNSGDNSGIINEIKKLNSNIRNIYDYDETTKKDLTGLDREKCDFLLKEIYKYNDELISILDLKENTNEYAENEKNRTLLLFESSLIDTKNYIENYNKIENSFKDSFYLVLGGHQHSEKIDCNKHIIEAARTFDTNDKVDDKFMNKIKDEVKYNYVIIDIKNKKCDVSFLHNESLDDSIDL